MKDRKPIDPPYYTEGNCVGCPRATLDLRNVVERLVKNRFPQITTVNNVF